jgi:hypothetical protein
MRPYNSRGHPRPAVAGAASRPALDHVRGHPPAAVLPLLFEQGHDGTRLLGTGYVATPAHRAKASIRVWSGLAPSRSTISLTVKISFKGMPPDSADGLAAASAFGAVMDDNYISRRRQLDFPIRV